MAAVAFDTLKCVHRLKDAGFTDKQAEAQAEIMAEAFVFNMDVLVTKDYLDARLDARFANQDARIDRKFAAVDVQFTQIKGHFRLLYWMLAVIMASTVVPQLNALLSS